MIPSKSVATTRFVGSLHEILQMSRTYEDRPLTKKVWARPQMPAFVH